MKEQSKRRTANLIKKAVHQGRTSLEGRMRADSHYGQDFIHQRPDTFSQATS